MNTGNKGPTTQRSQPNNNEGHSMNYRDIKNIVIGSTHKLCNLLPPSVVSELSGDKRPYILAGHYLAAMETPRITCVTHAYVPKESELDELDLHLYTSLAFPYEYGQHHVCSILVDGIPAFFFIHAQRCDMWKPRTHTYILDMGATSNFLQWMGVVQGEPAGYVMYVHETDQVGELDVCSGVKIQYGNCIT